MSTITQTFNRYLEMSSRFLGNLGRTCHQIYSHRPGATIFSALCFSCGFIYVIQSRAQESRLLKAKRNAPKIGGTTCKYRLDNGTSGTCPLPDGRKLGFAEYGASDGIPVFFLHGTPGSRFEAASLDDLTKQLNVRLISVDRPGIGWSSAQPGRTLETHAYDIDNLANYLELDRFAVLGISGGGPYALACARFISNEKCKAVGVVVGMGAPDMSKKGMRWFNWLGFTLGYPYLHAKLFYWAVTHTLEGRLDLTEDERLELVRQRTRAEMEKVPAKDRAFWQDEDNIRLFLRSMQEVRSRDLVDGLLTDGRALALDWQFKIEDIPENMPVRLWYGAQDANCPPGYGRQTMERLGHRQNCLLRIEDETHISMWLNYREEFFKDLVEFM
ncbi:Hypothetical predicted protein [Lecanosticta acicola]|uniref:AB hydrolase-1 domain-containing protein n=1 Tax=Lecanosticta acicola TaxID=111012 RepID=A0AAI8YVQ8_9PEZI|nr:Hypothetical predicted protein [Lecanosticta acicola]